MSDKHSCLTVHISELKFCGTIRQVTHPQRGIYHNQSSWYLSAKWGAYSSPSSKLELQQDSIHLNRILDSLVTLTPTQSGDLHQQTDQTVGQTVLPRWRRALLPPQCLLSQGSLTHLDVNWPTVMGFCSIHKSMTECCDNCVDHHPNRSDRSS